MIKMKVIEKPMNFYQIFTTLASGNDIKISDNDRKKVIFYLIDTMNKSKSSTLYEIKKYLDGVVSL